MIVRHWIGNTGYSHCPSCGQDLSTSMVRCSKCGWPNSETTAAPMGLTFYPEPQPIPTGWLCPRCGKSNAPSVLVCSCQPGEVPK